MAPSSRPHFLYVESGLLGYGGHTTDPAIIVPTGLEPGFAGTTFHHAFLVIDSGTFHVLEASNAVSMRLVP